MATTLRDLDLQYAVVGVATLLGPLLHGSLYIRGEWHRAAPKIMYAHCAGLAATFSYLAAKIPYGKAVQLTVMAAVCYCVSLSISILGYRVLFHQLRHFPGPKLAATSKLWQVWQCKTSQNHLLLEKLFQRYGDFVRTGPSEITCFHPDVFQAIDGYKSECIKAEWYDVLWPQVSLVSSRDPVAHKSRRKQWRQGFTQRSLRQFECKTSEYVEIVDKCIAQDVDQNKPTTFSDLCYWFGFDTMGLFVFDKSFNMLTDRKWHYIITKMQHALTLLGPLSPVPWLVQIAFALAPPVSWLRDWFETLDWTKSEMVERIKKPPVPGAVPDVASYLIDDVVKNPGDGDSWRWLCGDALLAVVAGSDPTASSSTGIFSLLGKYPEHVEKLYQELRDIEFSDVDTLTHQQHLNGVINEGLRLFPALVTGGNRKVVKEGITIAGHYIPPDTTIVAPRFVISRREDCFEQPLDFVPERWYSQPEKVLNQAAFTPFGSGYHRCVGMNLALDNMRMLITLLVQKYKFGYPAGDDGAEVLHNLRDYFVSRPGQLRLCFTPR